MNPEDTAAYLFICSRQGTLHLTQYKVSCILNQKKTQKFLCSACLVLWFHSIPRAMGPLINSCCCDKPEHNEKWDIGAVTMALQSEQIEHETLSKFGRRC